MGSRTRKKAIELLFEKSNTNKHLKFIYAEAVASNIASWKILESNDFIRTGEVEQGFQKDGIVGDLYQYLLKRNHSSLHQFR